MAGYSASVEGRETMNSGFEVKGCSLSYRFIIWFVVVALLPLALFGYLSLQQNEDALRSESLSRMSRLADKKTLEIKTYLLERSQDAQLLARSNLAEIAMADLSRIYSRYRADSAEYRKASKPFNRNFAAYIGHVGRICCVLFRLAAGRAAQGICTHCERNCLG